MTVSLSLFFFFSSAVFQRTQKCIINNIHFWQQKKKIIPTQLVHTQAELFKCTMIDSISKRVPALAARLGRSTPTKQSLYLWACLSVCMRACMNKASSCLAANNTQHTTHTHFPSSCHNEVRATQKHQDTNQTLYRHDASADSIQECRENGGVWGGGVSCFLRRWNTATKRIHWVDPGSHVDRYEVSVCKVVHMCLASTIFIKRFRSFFFFFFSFLFPFLLKAGLPLLLWRERRQRVSLQALW